MPKKAKARQRDPDTGRWKTDLSELVLAELCAMHERGDFRNVTALRCGVHPKRLTAWLKQGAEHDDGSLHARLFLAFGRIEGALRERHLGEVLDTQVKREETVFEEGKPASKVAIARSIDGVTWYMERRWRQWRADWVPREDDGDVLAFVERQAGTLTLEAAMYIVTQIAANMPAELRPVFARHRWVQLPADSAPAADIAEETESDGEAAQD